MRDTMRHPPTLPRRSRSPFVLEQRWSRWLVATLGLLTMIAIGLVAVGIVYGVLESRDNRRFRELDRDIDQLRAPVGFLARKAASQTIPVSTFTTVTGWIIPGAADPPAYDNSNGAMNLATGVWTTILPGKYQVSASICWTAGAVNVRQMLFVTNGTGSTTPVASVLAFGVTCTTNSITMNLPVGMSVEVQVSRSTAGAEVVNAFSVFSIERVADL